MEISNKIKLYHGTTLDALNNILENGYMDASEGVQHGETHGMNWFSLKYGLNFFNGALFSLEIPKEDFERYFEMVNNSECVSKERKLNLSNYYLQIEKLGPCNFETLSNMLKMCSNDIWEFYHKLMKRDWFKDTYFDISDPLFINLFKQLGITSNDLQKEGLVENYQYEYAKDDVDMTSFEKQNELNQDIWDSEDKLNSRVRLKLLDIADDFIETLGISWIKPIDIILTGSLCNYNWSRYSDVDLHIVIDFNEISKKTEFVQEYFNAKKTQWNDLHTDLTIFGFNVELYVENIDNDSVRGGIYSLEKDEWIKKPLSKNISKISSSKEEKIKYFASYFLTKIEDIEDEFNGPLDDVILRKLSNKCDKLIKTLQTIRKNGLKEKGEMSVGNIIYKICRRTNYLDKLYDLKNKIYDKINSLD